MQEIEPNSHQTTRELLDKVVGKRLTSIRRRILHDPDETACAFEWLTGLELRVGRHVVYIDVDPDDDTLLVSKSPQQDKDTLVIDGSSHPLWKPILGKNIIFAWTMINSMGYLDGLAFAFETYAPSATIIAAGSQIHEFSNHDRDRRVAEIATTSAKQSIDQTVATFVSNLVYIMNKAAQAAAHEALKGERERAKTSRPPRASRPLTGGSSAAPRKLRQQAEAYIKNNPECDADQIAGALGTANTPGLRAATQELQRTGDVARPKGRAARSNPTRGAS